MTVPRPRSRGGLRTRRPALLALVLLSAAACGGTRPAGLGVTGEGTLAPCPETPNCIHTVSRPGEVAPLVLAPAAEAEGPEAVWPRVVDAVTSLPRTEVVEEREVDAAGGGGAPGRYLHAESRSRIFRFVDDVEVLWPPDGGRLVVRSASRVGRSDLGVNEDRVASLREALVERGVVAPAAEGADGEVPGGG